jgi:hypothetical protein
METGYAPIEEKWATPERLPIRDYQRKLAAGARPVLYSPPEPEEDANEHAFVFARVNGSIDDHMDELRELYDFTDDGAVEDFLREDPSLIDFLLGAADNVREYFDPDNPLALRVVKEPDARDGRRLFVFIHTTLRPREALARLDKLDHDWWLEALPATKGKLTIDIYYD